MFDTLMKLSTVLDKLASRAGQETNRTINFLISVANSTLKVTQNASGTEDFLIDETLQPHSTRLRPEGERFIGAESHMANFCSVLHAH